MKQNYLWTSLKARLLCVSSNHEANYNWIFIPGGPGLGSEYLSSLTKLLHLPGTTWHLDLPGDGSNTTDDNAKNFSYWQQALIETVQALDNVILVTHSSSGMFVLATPALEKWLSGLVLIGSAPDRSWERHFQRYVKAHPLPQAEEKQKIYSQHPSNRALQELVIASASHCATPRGIKKLIALFKQLPFNYQTFEWSEKEFAPTYQAKWSPKKIPTLLLAGSEDHITPLAVFSKSKKFKRKNISMQTIKNAGHYPWLENPKAVMQAFQNFIRKMQGT